MSSITIALGLAAGLAVAPVHDPDQDRRPSSLLPHTTLAFAEFAGLGACRDAASGSELYALLQRLATSRLGKSPAELVAQQLLPQLNRDLAEAGLDARALRELLSHPLALAAGRVVSFDNDFMPSVALVVDTGDDGPRFDRMFGSFASRLVENGDLRVDDEQFDGIALKVIRHERRSGDIAFARVDHFAVMTIGIGFMHDILRTAKDGTHSIIAEPVAVAGRRFAGASPLLWGCVNVHPIAELARLYAPYEADPILAALGLDSVDGLVFGTSFQGGTSADFVRLLGKVRDDGLLAALGGGRVDPSLLASLSADALLVGGCAMDTARIETAVHRFIAALPAIARREMERGLDRELHRELERHHVPVAEIHEILSSLGSEAAMGLALAPTGLGIPTGTLVVRLRDGQSVAERIADLLGNAGLDLRSQDVGGVTLRWTSLEGVPSGVSPAFAEKDGKLFLSSDVRTLRRSLSGEGSSLSCSEDSDAFATIQHSAGWMWLRVTENVTSLWKTYGPQVENLLEANPDAPIRAEDLPSAEELHAALRDVTIGAGIDAHGLAFRATSPVGFGGFLAGIGAIFDAAAGTRSKRDN
ncbi:MAG: hypothetical protein U1F36_02080 [Planctomycetota bacterium]